MCTGMKDWIAEVETQGQDNGLRLACLIMEEAHDGMTPAAIAEKLQIDSGIVSMILKAMGI